MHIDISTTSRAFAVLQRLAYVAGAPPLLRFTALKPRAEPTLQQSQHVRAGRALSTLHDRVWPEQLFGSLHFRRCVSDLCFVGFGAASPEAEAELEHEYVTRGTKFADHIANVLQLEEAHGEL